MGMQKKNVIPFIKNDPDETKKPDEIKDADETKKPDELKKQD